MAEGVDLGSAFGRIELDGSQAQQTVDSLASTMRSAGTAMSLGVTAPLVGIGAAAINSAADFEQSLNIMQQVSGATADQMATLQAQALEMGAVTSFSAGEAAQAQLELAKAGMGPLEVMQALPGVLDAAAAGGMGLAQSAGLVSAALNAFSLEADQSGRVANLLAAAANASAVDMADLGAGVQQGGFAFAAAGLALDDLVASTAILGNVGLTGSDAGTALKNAVMRLINPTKEAAGVMNDLGINVFDAQGAMLPWADVIQEFDTGLAGLNDQERNNALATILMSDGMKAMIPLLDEGKDGFLDMRKEINKEGAAADTAGARMKGMRGAVEYLMGSIDSFLIGTALPFLDSFSSIVRVVADAITGIGALPKPVMDAALAFAAVLAAAGPVMLAISGIAAAVGFLLSPLGLAVAGVAALAAGFVLWQNNVGNIQGITADFANQLKDMAEAATGIDFDALADGLRSFGSYLGAVAEDGDYLNDWLTHLPEPIQPAVQALGQLVAAFGGLAQTGDVGAFVASIQAIDWGGALASVGESLNGLAAGMVAALQAIDWGGALATATGWLDGLKDGIVTAVQSVDWGAKLTAAGDWLAGLWGGIVAGFSAIPWATALATVAGWLDGLKAQVVSAIQAIDWGGALTAAGDFLAGLWGSVVSAIQSIPWLTYLGQAGSFLAGLTQGVINRITTINWGALLTQAGDYLAGLWGNVVAALGRIPWATALTTAGAWLTNFTQGVVNRIHTINWGALLTQAGDFLAGLWGNVVGALGRIKWGDALATAAGWLDSLKANVVTAIQGIDWAGALATTGNAFGGLETAVSDGLRVLGFEDAADSLDGVRSAVEGLPATFASLSASLTGTRTALAGFWAQATALGATLATFFAPAVGRLQEAFAALPEKMAPLLPKLEALGGAFGGLMEALRPFIAAVGVVLAVAVDFGINRVTTAFETLPAVLGVIIDQVTATIQLITVILTEVVAGVQAAINGDWTAVWESAKTIAGEFNTFFRGLFSRLGTFMAAVAKNIADPIIDTLTDLGVDVDPILKGIQTTFENVWGAIQTAIQAVVDIVGTVTDAISGFKSFLDGLQLRNPFEGIAAAGQSVLDAIGKIGTAGGMDGDPNTPWAKGTSYYPGGMGTINERGYEQVVLPAGSRIYTHGQTNNLDEGGGQRPININLGGVTVSGDMDARRLGNLLRDQLIMAGV